MAWIIPPEFSISEEEAALFAEYAVAANATLAVETGTGFGVGTRRLRAALPDSIRLVSVDNDPVTPPIPGVEIIKTDSQRWQPTEKIGALLIDCVIPRFDTRKRLSRFCLPGAPIFLHDADKGVDPDWEGSTVRDRLQIGFA